MQRVQEKKMDDDEADMANSQNGGPKQEGEEAAVSDTRQRKWKRERPSINTVRRGPQKKNRVRKEVGELGNGKAIKKLLALLMSTYYVHHI